MTTNTYDSNKQPGDMQTLEKFDRQSSDILTSQEIELILACSRTQHDLKTIDRIHNLVAQALDWGKILQVAYMHGVMQMLYWNLNNICPNSVPPEVLASLRQYYQKNTFNNLIQTQELLKIQQLFTEHQIPILPFKGPLLASAVYRNYSLRHITDLDFLVRKEDFSKAVDLLTSQGLEAKIQVRWECHLIGKNGLLNIDLHSEIIPEHLSCAIEPNFWWDSLGSYELGGSSVPNLSPEAWFLLLILNGNKECWRNLKRICDVAEVIRAYPKMDWDAILSKADRFGFRRLTNLAFLLVGNLLAAPIPEPIWQQAVLDKKAGALFLEISKQLFVENKEIILEVHINLFHIRTRERIPDKVKVLVDLMNYSGWFTPTEKDLNLVKLPNYLYFLYYFIRPVRVLQKYQVVIFKFMDLSGQKKLNN
ncbi:nucleotidyltransferase family protein [Calothrix sp. PCC 6303]|uniref:nucleotidyltransferase domain-containing protein n=1 Tax=Calothrix sp. PCC 6303 TaxID=1170562 RepID=UPI0002A0302C|nr:nucleotidyltransferase family protein [Calothrix sp. PCC 6303]AFZ01183.1 hypothetical protein Cal6303_2162 [Calothrix sp. PCC 6303]